MTLQKVYTHRYHLTAAQCNGQRELAPPMLLQHIIEVATEHADALGVGFRNLADDGVLWVLSRCAFEVKRYPKILEDYSLSTWVESYNHHFSQRNFEIRDAADNTIGYARTIWVAIDLKTRRPASLTNFDYLARVVSEKQCPISPQGKIRPALTPQMSHPYTFQVSDIDINRHVNSARYAELVINQLDLDTYDRLLVSRFEIEYRRETHFGDTVEVNSIITPGGDTMETVIARPDGPACLCRLTLSQRTTQI